MAFQTNKTVLAIVAESTEGTPVLPSAGTDYIALQEGFDLAPSFEKLDNAELTGSIGQAKPVLGKEAPTASLSHYIRHSGVEGQAPGYGLLLKGAIGDQSTASTEYNTIAGSTAGTSSVQGIIKVDTGEGATFERGEALLIKDGTNGYAIRNIDSIATDDLTINFNLGSAPASGVNLGKAVLYKPGESHPSFSVWNFRGNGAAVELIAGTKVTDMSIDITAGQMINGSFSLAGIKYYFNPIQIDATNNKLDFANDAIPTEKTATIASATYQDPHELAAAIETAMDAVSGDDITVTYSDSTGKFTIASAGGTFQLLWNTGTNTANTIGADIGFSIAADDTGATTYTADNQISLSRLHTPSYDNSDPLVAKSNSCLIGSHYDNVCFEASTISVSLANDKVDIESICADSGVSGSLMGGRTVTVSVTALLDSHDCSEFYKFRTGTNTKFMYAFGVKSGGNWVAGKCANMYIPTATITSYKLSDNNGLVSLEMELQAYVASGAGEFYMNFL